MLYAESDNFLFTLNVKLSYNIKPTFLGKKPPVQEDLSTGLPATFFSFKDLRMSKFGGLFHFISKNSENLLPNILLHLAKNIKPFFCTFISKTSLSYKLPLKSQNNSYRLSAFLLQETSPPQDCSQSQSKRVSWYLSRNGSNIRSNRLYIGEKHIFINEELLHPF